MIKTLMPIAVEKIGYDTVTKKNSMIMQFTFVSAVLNSGVITLFTNADLRWYWGLGLFLPNIG